MYILKLFPAINTVKHKLSGCTGLHQDHRETANGTCEIKPQQFGTNSPEDDRRKCKRKTSHVQWKTDSMRANLREQTNGAKPRLISDIMGLKQKKAFLLGLQTWTRLWRKTLSELQSKTQFSHRYTEHLQRKRRLVYLRSFMMQECFPLAAEDASDPLHALHTAKVSLPDPKNWRRYEEHLLFFV